MDTHKYVVKVPKPQANAYNPDRPISDLVRNQIKHLSLAERHLAKRHRAGVDIYSIKTERQASAYIEHLTRKLHPKGAKKAKAKGKAKLRRKPSKSNSKRK